MRQYPNLTELVIKETNHIAPKSAARKIEKTIAEKHPNANALVLFTAGNNWLVVPVGPGENLRNTAQAARARVSGKTPVAFCTRQA